MTYVFRLHPFSIINGMRKYVFLLAIPLLRGILSVGSGFSEWLSGAWIDLLALIALLSLGVIRWRFSTVKLAPRQLVYQRGLVYRTEEYFETGKLTVLHIARPLYLRPFRAAVIKLRTRARETRASQTLVMRYADAFILEKMLYGNPETPTYRADIRASASAIALSSAAGSSVAGGLTFFAALLSNTGNVLGDNFTGRFFAEVSRVIDFISFGLPPIVVITLAVFLFGYLLAFARQLAEYTRFSVSRTDDMFYVSGGLISRYDFRFHLRAVESLDLRYRLVTRFFSGYAVRAHVSGLHTASFTPELIPVGSLRHTVEDLHRLFPAYGSFACAVKTTPKRAAFRFLWPPAAGLIAAAAGTAAIGVMRPDVRELAYFWCAMIGVLILWYGIHRILALRHTGIGIYPDHLCAKYMKNTTFHRVYMKREHVVRIDIRRSIFQRRSGLCDIVIYDLAEKKRRHHVRAVPYETVRVQLETNGYISEPAAG